MDRESRPWGSLDHYAYPDTYLTDRCGWLLRHLPTVLGS